MKRLHVNLSVRDLDESIGFYTSLFAADPVVTRDDYAKWMLEDPRVNFAITTRGQGNGVDHLGIQVEDRQELDDVHARLKRAGGPLLEQGKTTCCYAHSEKNWTQDPQGVTWETFLTTGESTEYGSDRSEEEQGDACCVPSPAQAKAACCG